MSTRYRTLVNSNPVNAIVSYAISQGWTIPSASTINAMNTFITSLQISGIWDKYDIFYNFRYNNTALANFSRINWKNPGSYTITYSGSFDYTINGYQAVESAYLDTGFFPAINGVNFQLNDANITFSLQMIDNTAPTTWPILNNESSATSSTLRGYKGASFPSTSFLNMYINSSSSVGGVLSTVTSITIPTTASSIAIGSRYNSSDISAFFNGQFLASSVQSSVSIHNSSIKLNYTTASSFSLPTRLLQLAGAGKSLTSTDAANLQTYYDVFYTTLNNTVSNIIQLSSFTPTPSTISSRVSVSTVSDTITISGVMNGTWAIEMTYQIVPDTGYEAWVYSVTPSGPDPYGAIKLIDVYGTNSKTVENTDLFQSPGLVTDNGTYNFTIIGSLGFRYKIRFSFDLYQIVGSTYILVDSYTSPYTSIQEIT